MGWGWQWETHSRDSRDVAVTRLVRGKTMQILRGGARSLERFQRFSTRGSGDFMLKLVHKVDDQMLINTRRSNSTNEWKILAFAPVSRWSGRGGIGSERVHVETVVAVTRLVCGYNTARQCRFLRKSRKVTLTIILRFLEEVIDTQRSWWKHNRHFFLDFAVSSHDCPHELFSWVGRTFNRNVQLYRPPGMRGDWNGFRSRTWDFDHIERCTIRVLEKLRRWWGIKRQYSEFLGYVLWHACQAAEYCSKF